MRERDEIKVGVNVEKVGVRVSGNKSGSGNDIVRTRVEERSVGRREREREHKGESERGNQ